MILRKVKYLFILLILFPLSSQVSMAAVPSAGDSFILAPTTSDVITKYSITIWAADASNSSLGNVEVSLSVTDGIFTSSGSSIIIANTTSGLLYAEWNSPAITTLENNRIVTFTAVIDDGSSGVSITATSTLSHQSNRGIIGSISSIPNSMVSGVTYGISTQVLDINGDSVSDITVEYSSVEGLFGAEIGASDSNGFYNTTFTAPTLDPQLIQLNFTIEVKILASVDINITLSVDISTNLSNASSLVVVVDSPSEINNGGSVNLLFLATADGSPAFGGTISLTATSGKFTNNDVVISTTFNNSGYAEIVWTAPTVTENTTVSFNYDASYLLDISDNGIFDINVLFETQELRLEYTIANSSILQNELNLVTITVLDNKTDVPVPNVPVTIFADMGMWNENLLDSIVLSTDSNGEVSSSFNGSQLLLVFDEHTVEITGTVESPAYKLVSITFNFTLIKVPPVYNFTVSPISSTIEYGDSLNLLLQAKVNNAAYINATFLLSSSAAVFSGETSLRDKTDAVGSLVVVFDSTEISKIVEQTTIYILIELVNSGLDTLQVTIVINPIEVTTGSASTNLNGTELSSPTIAGLIIGILAVVSIGGFIIVQRRK